MKEVSGQKSSDTYALGRDFKAASRLDGQHYLWQETLGFLLHPTILESLQPPDPEPRSSSPVITDVACGTAIWARQVAQRLPHARVEACDISLAQCPPNPWLPQNLALSQWDLFKDPRESMWGASEAVHVRLIFSIIRHEDDARLVVQQLAKLLKPGGWIQWDELDVASSFIKRVENSDAERSTPAIDETVQRLKKIGSWVCKLPQIMQDAGLERAEILRFDEKPELARAFFDNHLGKDEEVAQGMIRSGGGGEEGKHALQKVHDTYEESKLGAVICTPKVVCIARKRSSVT